MLVPMLKMRGSVPPPLHVRVTSCAGLAVATWRREDGVTFLVLTFFPHLVDTCGTPGKHLFSLFTHRESFCTLLVTDLGIRARDATILDV